MIGGVVADSTKRSNEQRHKHGWRCVDCDRVTSVVNEAGEPQCSPCQRILRNATAKAVATCAACGEPMLTEAQWCGFCVAEFAVSDRLAGGSL